MSVMWPARFDLLHSLHTGAAPLLMPSLVNGATLAPLLEGAAGAFRLTIAPPAPDQALVYTNAQLADDHMPRRHHRWRTPLTLSVEARFSAPAGLAGTAGFGFWNDPAGMSRRRLPALPQALWFFWHSPQSRLPLLFGDDLPIEEALPPPTRGFASTLHATAPGLLRAAAGLGRHLLAGQGARRPPWLDLLRAGAGSQSAPLPRFDEEWHCYQLCWHGRRARWLVDGREIFATWNAPSGRLALVIWIDNQFLVVRPDRLLRWQIQQGVTAAATSQSLAIRRFVVEPGAQEIAS